MWRGYRQIDAIEIIDEDSETEERTHSPPADGNTLLGIGSDLNIFPSNLDVTSSQNVLVPLTDSPGALTVLADSEIAVAGVISKADIENFIAFQTQNVQSTKFNFGINAASVDFDTLGIKQIDVLISINELPTLSIPQFSLVKLHAVDSSFALIPIQNAISSLQGIVLLTIHFADSTKADEKVTLQHQFIDMPILILQNADISP